MICPFCGREMQEGILSGDGRSGVVWRVGDKKASFIDKLGGLGRVTAAKHTLTSFTIQSYYCDICKKMIFDTDIQK